MSVSHPGARFLAPKEAPASVMAALRRSRELIVADELARVADDGEARALHADLARMNWALVLPLLSEDTVVGAIVLGAKRSGDAYYPQDLDLLTTLANQAGIAIKNAQLYAEILLAKEDLPNIVGTIESGVVAIDESGHVTMFNRGAEHLTGMRAADIQERPAAALPACLAEALESALANGQALTSLSRAGVPRALIGGLKERSGVVRRLAAKGAFVRVALAANAVSGLMAQLYGHFRDRVPPSVLTLDYLDREAQLRSLMGGR